MTIFVASLCAASLLLIGGASFTASPNSPARGAGCCCGDACSCENCTCNCVEGCKCCSGGACTCGDGCTCPCCKQGETAKACQHDTPKATPKAAACCGGSARCSD